MLLKELETETEILARIPGPQMEHSACSSIVAKFIISSSLNEFLAAGNAQQPQEIPRS